MALISEVNLATTFVELDDGFGRGEWLLPLAFLPTLGFLYLFLTSSLVVTEPMSSSAILCAGREFPLRMSQMSYLEVISRS